MLEAGNFWIMTVNIISQKYFTMAPFFPAPAATRVERAVLFSLGLLVVSCLILAIFAVLLLRGA